MAAVDNRPQLQDVLDKLNGLPAALLAAGDPGQDGSFRLLQTELDQAIAWIEDTATTSFNACSFYNTSNFDLYDGNTTNQIVVRKRPVLSIQLLQVVTPILGYTRVYLPEEIKDYVKQGVIKIWTYKLAVEQALLQTLDYQAWGNLFPPLPQSVQVAYTYGYPTFDPEFTGVDATSAQSEGGGGLFPGTGAQIVNAPATSWDGGITWARGDQREPELNNWLTNLQEACVCQAAAQFLAQTAGLSRGIVQSVSFDGYSRGLSASPFQSEIQSLIARRDELMKRRARRFIMSTVGG
jgi:hypothetical protein